MRSCRMYHAFHEKSFWSSIRRQHSKGLPDETRGQSNCHIVSNFGILRQSKLPLPGQYSLVCIDTLTTWS